MGTKGPLFHLQGCVKDFHFTVQFCQTLGLNLHASSLLDTSATRAAAMDRLDTFFQQDHKLFIVTYSGHGAPDGGWCFLDSTVTPALLATIWNLHQDEKGGKDIVANNIQLFLRFFFVFLYLYCGTVD